MIILRQQQISAETGVKALFVVPKKKFRDANDRNKLKRRMREAYRLQKAEFYQTFKAENNSFTVGFIYYANQAETYTIIAKAIKKLLTTTLL